MDESQLREVVVTRSDDRGYGLTVSGESPVMVQDVKEGGPACLAGVQVGDCIMKVNGTPVSKFNHREVVQIIKSSHSVRLTVCAGGSLTAAADSQAGDGGAGSHSAPASVLLRHHTKDKQHNKITAPLPVNNQLQNQFDVNRHKMLSKMLDTQLKTRESILVELEKKPPKALQKTLEKELETINNLVSTIQTKLKATEAENPLSQSVTSESSSTSSSSGGSRPPSQHCRAKSSPETITANPQARHEAFSGHLSGSDSLGDLASLHSSNSNHSNRSSSRVASALMEDDPPPGTPPPPYANNASNNNNNNNITSSTTTAEEHDDEGDSTNPSSSLATPAGAASVAAVSAVGGADHGGGGGGGGGGGAVNSADDDDQDDDENYSTIPDEMTTSMMGVMDGHTTWAQTAIQSMEDDDFSDSEAMYGDHGPFQSLSKLWTHPAYLAVFMNFIISNCSPATAFFYMITDLYKEGAAKEMKKWAYEIHSSFLLPSAPMPVGCTIDDAVLNEIDETLRHDLDKEETLRKVFLKVRQRAREVLNEQLADFRSKRMAGLGNIFGPPDAQLMESQHNKNKEMSIIELVLVPFLESVSDDWNHDDHSLIMASSLATLLWKWFNVRSPKAMALIDRCPLYVNRDRPLRSKFFKANKKQLVREHCFNQMTYYSVTYCNHCQDVIWGVAPQGYQCANCEMNIHKTCAKLVEELCIGQVRKKAPRDKKLHSFLGKIIPDDREAKRKSSQLGSNFPMDKRRGTNDDELVADLLSHQPDVLPSDSGSGVDKSSSTTPGGSGSSTSGHPGGRDPSVSRRSDSIPGASLSSNHTCDFDDGGVARDLLHDDEAGDSAALDMAAALPDATSSGKPNLQKKKSGNPINRSESYKDKHQRKRIREDRRKHSDPNIPTSKSGDVDVDSGLKDNDSGSSSNSSLSLSLDSPSLEQVSRDSSQLLCPQLNNDSDVEAEADLPDWSSNVPADQLAGLPSRERKRQDTINELFHTEQTHVRMLKVMYSLFYNPLLSSGLLTDEQLNLLFPNLDTMLEIHSSFNKAMKKRRREQPLVQTIGDILTSMFEGPQGETFEHEAAVFVRSQSIGLEGLKLSKKRDQKLASFLQERENHPFCRRLQLKDMLPAGFQRLSKYPLLLESLLGYTDLDKYPEEYEQINRCLVRAKEILASVNAAVREEENHQRLIEIQRRLDQSNMVKNKHGHVPGLKGNLDLTKHRLIYEGPLTWRLSKGQKNVDLHVLVLEKFIVLLQKDSDKYVLKNYSLNKATIKEDSSHSPIIKFGTQFLYRAVATDNCAFFIVTTQCGPAQIYELVTSSPNDRKVWFRHFQETQASVNDNGKEGGRGSRRAQQPSSSQPQEHDPDTQPQPERDGGEDSLDDSEAADSGEGPTTPGTSVNNNNNATDSPQDSFAKKTEHLRRKDLKIKQALKEKQHIIADILDIPREHFGTLGDMASEPGSGPKEPRELVLAAIYQANCLQETLNEALTIRESDIVAAKAGGAESANKLSSSLLPLYPAPMNKLMCITGSLSHHLNALLNLVSERDDERDRMRKELVASRERMHQLHLNQSPGGASVSSHSSATPTNSRPNSIVSQTSTPAPDIRDDSETLSADERVRTSSTQEDLTDLIAREVQEEGEGSADGTTSRQAGFEASMPADDDAFPESTREEGSDLEPPQHHPPTT